MARAAVTSASTVTFRRRGQSSNQEVALDDRTQRRKKLVLTLLGFALIVESFYLGLYIEQSGQNINIAIVAGALC
jgi:hypothetical protein